MIAVSDSRGCVYNQNGLDVPKLIMYKEKTGQVLGFPGAEEIRPEELLALKWDMEIVGASSPAGDGDDPLRRLWHSNNKRLTWSSPQLDKLVSIAGPHGETWITAYRVPACHRKSGKSRLESRSHRKPDAQKAAGPLQRTKR